MESAAVKVNRRAGKPDGNLTSDVHAPTLSAAGTVMSYPSGQRQCVPLSPTPAGLTGWVWVSFATNQPVASFSCLLEGRGGCTQLIDQWVKEHAQRAVPTLADTPLERGGPLPFSCHGLGH